ncbi:MAG: YggU family protein [Hadesarchaea archaeon]|nr:YggU family protein [Hadesarchaea archaeon]
MINTILKESKDGVILDLHVIPNSNKFEFGDINVWRNQLKVKVHSPATKGKANDELLEKLSSTLGLDIKLISGSKSRNKRILVKETSIEELTEKLREIISNQEK